MIDERREEYLKNYKTYEKKEIDIFQDLDTALKNLKEPDISARKKGAKRLSYNVRRELFYSIRIWFLRKENMQQIFEQIIAESDEKIKADLVRTIYFFKGRFIEDASWWNWNKDELIVGEEYKKTVLIFIHSLVDSASLEVLAEIANLLLNFKDSKGWDIYIKVLAKRNNEDVMNFFHYHCSFRDNDPITFEQSNQLIDVLSNILKKSKNNIVIQKACDSKAYLLLMFGNEKGWDVYADTLENHICISLIPWFYESCIFYLLILPMNTEQKARLSTILTNIIKNSKDNYDEGIINYVTSTAKKALNICKKSAQG